MDMRGKGYGILLGLLAAAVICEGCAPSETLPAVSGDGSLTQERPPGTTSAAGSGDGSRTQERPPQTVSTTGGTSGTTAADPSGVYDPTAPLDMRTVYMADISPGNPGWWESGVEYARILEVGHSRSGENGTLLATFEELNGGQVDPTGFPVYISRDVGRTWTRQSFVTDPGPLSAQWMPQLFELPRQLGDMPAGTILLAGVSLGPGRTAVMLYKSEDTGQSWDKVATVAVGGNQGGNGIYEPFLVMLEDGTLVCYYSDELERASHSQRLVYRTSKNGVNWNEPVEVVASPLQSDRPGMSVVTRLGDGRYFMVYEMVGRNGNPIYGRYSEDGLHWGDAGNIGVLIQSGDGKRLGSAPYCGWTEQGGDCGTLIVSGTFMGAGSSATGTDYFVSHDYGKTWTTMPHPIPYSKRHSKFGYSNGFAFSSSGRYLYAVNNPEGEHAGYSKISFALVSLRE